MVKDPQTGEYTFKKGSLAMLKGILKDGQGNLVDFEEINGQLLPKVVDGDKDSQGNYILIRQVLMKNKDGSPVVSVPLNVDLTDKTNPNYDPTAVEYVNKKIKLIIRTIQSLIVEQFTING
ncbi:UNVERIFIED_CONTAM: hypothetical protein O8I53_06210 [Campylobacter lari]